MHVLTIVGARPQFIKAAVVSRALQASGIQESILHTGQHYDPGLSDVFFSELDIPKPAVHLGVGSASHGKQTADMLVGIEKAIQDLRPDWVLLYGDTNSTLAGALAASKLQVPIAHVEAGLRSFNRAMPEEINRIVADQLSDLLFCPTAGSIALLKQEGIHKGVHLVGDVMYDAALFYAERSPEADVLGRFDLEKGSYALTTVHRAENTDDPARLRNILAGLSEVGRKLPLVLPLHPRTKGVMEKTGVSMPAEIRVIEPVSYLEMIALERNAAVLLTDSGGVQKEAYFYQVPCVTLRDETEWTELVDAGWNTLTGADTQRIVAATESALQGKPADHPPLYGEGDAGQKIVELLS